MPREKIEVNTDNREINGPNVKKVLGVLFFIAALIYLSYCPVIFHWCFNFYHLQRSEFTELIIGSAMLLWFASLVLAGWLCINDKE